MKNHFIVTLLIVLMSGAIATAQTKKPTTTKKSTTTVQTSPSKTSTVKKTTTTTPVTPPVVEEKKTTTTTTTTTPTNQTTTSSTTTTTQSSGPSKGKKPSEVKPEKVNDAKTERVKEPKPEKVKKPKDLYSSGSGGIKFGIRLEASQALTFESGGNYDISPGVNAGLFVNIPLSEKISFQPEVLYSMQIAKIDPVKNTTNSILVPLTFNFSLGHGNTKFVISPGGYADYYLSSSNTTNGFTVSADLNGVDKFYYGAVLGLGVKINSKLLIETRAFYDLKTSQNKEILATFGVGYMF